MGEQSPETAARRGTAATATLPAHPAPHPPHLPLPRASCLLWLVYLRFPRERPPMHQGRSVWPCTHHVSLSSPCHRRRPLLFPLDMFLSPPACEAFLEKDHLKQNETSFR